nr:MAG TPA: hypothetical protein [Caudoviricetes sp.]
MSDSLVTYLTSIIATVFFKTLVFSWHRLVSSLSIKYIINSLVMTGNGWG